MNTHQTIVQKFDEFAATAVRDNAPKGDTSLQQGTLSRVKSYLSDFYAKVTVLNDVLVKKANELLDAAEKDPTINISSLKNELFESGKTSIGQFVSKYKPQ